MNHRYSNDIGMEFARIPIGTFLMGSPDSEIGRDTDEAQHRVRITKPYFIQTTAVTNAMYRKFRADHNSGSIAGFSLNGDEQPVVNVSWIDAMAFCNWLSDRDPKGTYSLPTEAQWEYAARAGSPYRYWWGENSCALVSHANVYDVGCAQAFSGSEQDNFTFDDGFVVTSPVGSFKPNPYGLFDTLGNVWELCSNWAYNYTTRMADLVDDPVGPASGNYKVARGADCFSIFLFARLANRVLSRPEERTETLGFRVVFLDDSGSAVRSGNVLREVRSATLTSTFDEPNGQPNYSCALFPTGRSPTWTDDISNFFTKKDIDHMKAVSANWPEPMILDDYASVKRDCVKIYSSVSIVGTRPRMPPSPSGWWTFEMKSTFYQWILDGCPY